MQRSIHASCPGRTPVSAVVPVQPAGSYFAQTLIVVNLIIVEILAVPTIVGTFTMALGVYPT